MTYRKHLHQLIYQKKRMKMSNIAQMLDELAELQQKRTELALPFRSEIAAIQDELDTVCAELDMNIQNMEGTIKVRVLSWGETVKGKSLMGVYSKGRTSWDTKALEGACAIYPGLEKLKKVGEPSVSIRTVK